MGWTGQAEAPTDHAGGLHGIFLPPSTLASYWHHLPLLSSEPSAATKPLLAPSASAYLMHLDGESM